jgi:hypothetical protein
MDGFVTSPLVEQFKSERNEVGRTVQYNFYWDNSIVGRVAVKPLGVISVTWYENGKPKGIEAIPGKAINAIPYNLAPPAGDLLRLMKTYLISNMAANDSAGDSTASRQQKDGSAMSIETERVGIIEGKTLQDVEGVLRENAYREQDPAMLVVLHKPGCVAGAIKQMHTNDDGRRVADELHRGTLKVTPDANGVRITFDLGDFPDRELFWRTVDDLQIKLGMPPDDDAGDQSHQTGDARIDNSPFNIPMTLMAFARKADTWISSQSYLIMGNKQIKLTMLPEPTYMFRVRRTAQELTATRGNEQWRYIRAHTKEADEIIRSGFCELELRGRFRGLVLEITSKEVDLQIVEILPEDYLEPIDELRENGTWHYLGDRRCKTDPEAHAALSGWLKSLEKPSRATHADDGAVRKRGGRPRDVDDDWAYNEIKRGRDQKEVYLEWLERIPKRRRANLADPQDSFTSAMRYRRKKEKRE